jgi:hypothetical protein
MKKKISVTLYLLGLLGVILILICSCKKQKEDFGDLPTISTVSVHDIRNTTAICKANLISEGGSPVVIQGVCWSTSSSPTANKFTDHYTAHNNQVAGEFEENIAFLLPATLYYVRAFANNSAGVAYGNEVTFTTLPTYNIGQSYGGGIIFYIDSTLQHGLIVASVDQSTGSRMGVYRSFYAWYVYECRCRTIKYNPYSCGM